MAFEGKPKAGVVFYSGYWAPNGGCIEVAAEWHSWCHYRVLLHVVSKVFNSYIKIEAIEKLLKLYVLNYIGREHAAALVFGRKITGVGEFSLAMKL